MCTPCKLGAGSYNAASSDVRLRSGFVVVMVDLRNLVTKTKLAQNGVGV